LISRIQRNYKLVIAEKPDAARRIAASLGKLVTTEIQGVEIFDVPQAFDRNHYVVCSAAGHLYAIADPAQIRRVYPVFDTDWVPNEQLFSRRRETSGRRNLNSYPKLANRIAIRLAVISELSADCEQIIHACDYDIEGETIGYNIIRYSCGNGIFGKPVLRARFSTLTDGEVKDSFSKMEEMDPSLAEAGRARHLVDYLWGVNLSRALSEAHRRVEGEFRNITVGRVQGPTLAFVVEREIKLKTHVPIPYWRLHATLQKENIKFEATYERDKIEVKAEADAISTEINSKKTAKVSKVDEKTSYEHPPYPFNLGDLQMEAFRLHKFSPSVTLSIAEKLYLRALISYPRTTSQKLPPSIGYSQIIDRLLRHPQYASFRSQRQEERRRLSPIQGNKDDPAHPAIYPTGITPRPGFSSSERKIYDLIVRRFLACFADDAMLKQTSAKLLIGNFPFVASGQSLLKEGWSSIYPLRFTENFAPLPSLYEGEEIQIVAIDLDSEFSRPLPLYSQASLLARMETESLGTKATRAETISTLLDRGYVLEEKTRLLTPTEIGLALIDSLERDCPLIISTEFTRKTDQDLEKILEKKERKEVVLGKIFHDAFSVLEQIRRSEEEIGSRLIVRETEDDHHTLRLSERDTLKQDTLIAKCPICQTGQLKVIRSLRTHKRFLGCTNYSNGCRASAPLPQRGIIRKYPHQCEICGWPMVSIKFSLRSKSAWNICSNSACPSKQSNNKKEESQN
jgi:DNA topoisomerase I